MGKEPSICSKCGELHYCEDHHILPKIIFGESETSPLCKNCHDKYHRFLGFKYTRKKNAQPKEFYQKKWVEWATGTLIFIGTMLLLTLGA